MTVTATADRKLLAAVAAIDKRDDRRDRRDRRWTGRNRDEAAVMKEGVAWRPWRW